MSKPILFLGSEGPAVVELTTRLAKQGYFWGTATTFTEIVEDAVTYFQATHIDSVGKWLKPDGVVGEKTWWALENPDGEAQRSHIKGSGKAFALLIPDGLGPKRTRILEVALAEHAQNVREIPPGSNRGPDVDKYLPDFTKKEGQPGPAWCCFFYSWVVKEALGVYPIGKREGSCAAARTLASRKGLWLPNTKGVRGPEPGDAFILARGHIGFVLRVSDTHMNTVEGNCGNRVKVGLRKLADPQLAGFIVNSDESADGFERGVMQAAHVSVDTVR